MASDRLIARRRGDLEQLCPDQIMGFLSPLGKFEVLSYASENIPPTFP
jgi:hypothetical protein